MKRITRILSHPIPLNANYHLQQLVCIPIFANLRGFSCLNGVNSDSMLLSRSINPENHPSINKGILLQHHSVRSFSSAGYEIPPTQEINLERSPSCMENESSILKFENALSGMNFLQCVELVDLLGQENLLWSDFPETLQVKLRDKFYSGCRDPNELCLGDFSTYITAFQAIDFQWYNQMDLLQAFSDKILDIVKDPQNLDGQELEIPRMLFLCSTLGISKELLRSDVVNGLMRAIGKFPSCVSNPSSLANTFYALGEAGIDWQRVSEASKEVLENSLKSQLFHFTIHDFIRFTHGTLLLKYKWQRNREIRNSAFSKVLQLLRNNLKKKMDSLELALLIYGLGRVDKQLDYSPLTEDHRQLILELIRSATNKSMNPSSLSHIAHGLGELQYEWWSLPAPLRHSFENQLISNIPRMKSHEFFQWLHGAALLQHPWYRNATILQLVGQQIILFYGNDLPEQNLKIKSQNIVELLLALSEQSPLKLSHFHPDVIEIIFAAIVRLSKSFHASHVSQVFASLGKLDVSFDSLPDLHQKALISVTIRRIKEWNVPLLSQFLIGATEMHFNWKEYPLIMEGIYSRILDRIGNRKKLLLIREGNEITLILVAFGKSNIQENSLSQEIKDALLIGLQISCHQLNRLALSQAIYGLGKMSWKWEMLPSELRNQIENRSLEKIKEFSIQEMNDYLIGCYGMELIWKNHENLSVIIIKTLFENLFKQLKSSHKLSFINILSLLQKNQFMKEDFTKIQLINLYRAIMKMDLVISDEEREQLIVMLTEMNILNSEYDFQSMKKQYGSKTAPKKSIDTNT